ncbi:hypothetical protein [Paracholeplasma manati]|uniref:hypothetical protein n=1 Tax=Paracholeplasma manati TaxID=591373 RepID=UPI0024080122|nr:hypothetical protein [Paracholeplasma manati]MDG0888302.1 hypothetical protein [Paracholeplasma manati]
MENTMSHNGLTIRELLIQIKTLLESHLVDLKQIQTIYQQAQTKDVVGLYQKIIASSRIYEVMPTLKGIDINHIQYEIKSILSRLFYESGFRKDIFEYDMERLELIESFNESIHPQELLTILFDMASDDDNTLMFHILEGKFIQAYDLVLKQLNDARFNVDDPMMSEYQRALNHLYNVASDERVAKESYPVLNRLIKKE